MMDEWVEVPMTTDRRRLDELAVYGGPQRALAHARTVLVRRRSAMRIMRPGVQPVIHQVIASIDRDLTFLLTTLFIGPLTAEMKRALGIRDVSPTAEPAATAAL